MKRYKNIVYSLKRYDYLEGNFTQISNDVFKLTNGNEFKVYCYLCCNYNKEYGYAYPSLDTISNNTNMSVKTVQRCIDKLVELKLIEKITFTNKTSKFSNNCYRVFYPIIIKNEVEEERKRKEQEELKKTLKTIDESIEGKVYTYTIEIKSEGEE